MRIKEDVTIYVCISISGAVLKISNKKANGKEKAEKKGFGCAKHTSRTLVVGG
jgi:hypothetical protein